MSFFLVEMNLKLFQPVSVVMIMAQLLLSQFRRLLQIKKIITNSPCTLYFVAYPQNIMNNTTNSKMADTSKKCSRHFKI